MAGFECSHHNFCFYQQVKCLCGLLWFWLLRDTLWSANPWVVSSLQPLMLQQVVHSPGSWLAPVLSLLLLVGQGNELLPQNRSHDPDPANQCWKNVLHWSTYHTRFHTLTQQHGSFLSSCPFILLGLQTFYSPT